MPRRIKGFSLIEVMVAVAIMAIMAGAALPLMVRAVNQQRTQATRDSMKVMFEAMFGSRERRVPNMRADYGFNPAALTDLRDMVAKPAGLKAWGAALNFFPWGWNGPYWYGTVVAVAGVNVPADAWGHPFQLLNPGGTSWVLVSLGPDGVLAPGGDDLYFPSITGAATTLYDSSVVVTVDNQRSSAEDVTVQIQDRDGGINPRDSPIASQTFTQIKSLTVPATPTTVRPGPVTVTFNVTSGISVKSYEVVDLLPGQLYTKTFTFK